MIVIACMTEQPGPSAAKQRSNLPRTLAALLGGAWLGVVLTACAPSMPVFSGTDYQPILLTPELVRSLDQGGVTTTVPLPAHGPSSYEYTLAPGDLLAFTLWDHLSGSAGSNDAPGGDSPKATLIKIESNGTAYFTNAGAQPVAGKTIAEARQLVERALAKYYRRPQFTLEVQEFHGQPVTVSGAVAKPGVQYLTYVPLSLQTALEAAGGPLPAADLGTVQIVHRGGQRETVDLTALLYHGDTSQERILVAGDTLLVPENHRNRIFVMGEVMKPEAQYIPAGHLSLTEALNQAGGLNLLSSSAAHIYVIRGVISDTMLASAEARPAGSPPPVLPPASPPAIYQLDASSPTAFQLADQFDLKPRDIVYAGTAPVTQWQRFISQAIPTSFSTAAQVTH